MEEANETTRCRKSEKEIRRPVDESIKAVASGLCWRDSASEAAETGEDIGGSRSGGRILWKVLVFEENPLFGSTEDDELALSMGGK